MATFRRNGSGDWVVCGTPDEVKVGKCKVERKDGKVRWVDVHSVGAPFRTDRGLMVYGYLKPQWAIDATKPAPVVAPEPEVTASDDCGGF